MTGPGIDAEEFGYDASEVNSLKVKVPKTRKENIAYLKHQVSWRRDAAMSSAKEVLEHLKEADLAERELRELTET